MAQVAATYTFVVDVDDDELAAAQGTDRDQLVGDAVEEYVHSVSDARSATPRPSRKSGTIEEVGSA